MYEKNRLGEVMKSRKHKSVEVARKLGVTPYAVAMWKGNHKRATEANLAQLCCYLEVNPEELIYLDFSEFKKTYNIPEFKKQKHDQIQTPNNPRDRKDKGGGG